MKNRIIVFICMIAIAAALLAGCGSNGEDTTEKIAESKTIEGQTTYPVTVKDDYGNEITLDKEPQKIISLAPASTEIVCAIDGIERIVGRSEIDDYPAEVKDIPSMGAYYEPNVEMIVAAAPDLIISSNYMDDAVKAQLEGAGAKVFMCYDRSIDVTLDQIKRIGQMINKNDEAKKIIDSIEDTRKEIAEKIKNVKDKKKVFIDIGEYYSAGPGSLLNDILSELEVTNVAADAGSEWPQLSSEQIIAANPDVYISFYSTVDEIKKMSGFDQLNAVKNDEIAVYDMYSNEASMMQRSGPRLAEGLMIFAKAIYPEIFK